MGQQKTQQTPSKITTQTKPSPTPDPTANWKTYSDDKYGYLLKFPADWTIASELSNLSDGTNKYIAFTDPNLSESSIPVLAISIKQSSPYATELTKAKKAIGASQEEDIAIDNNKGKKYSTDGPATAPGPEKLTRYVFPLGKGTLLITAGPEQEGKIYADEISQILSTFKFTDQTDPTANWKTYASTKYGYSIKYPADVKYEETNVQGAGGEGIKETNTIFKLNGGSLEIKVNGGGMGITPIKTENIVVAGIETTKFYTTESTGVIKEISSPNKDGIIFYFTLPKDNKLTKDANVLIDQMLSTFKFTN